MRRMLTWIFPYRTLMIETSLSPAEVRERLERDVAPREAGLRLFRSRDGRFNGSVSETGFDIRRTISGRNSWLPNVVGTIQATAFGSRVYVRMKPPQMVNVFMALWLGTVALMAIPFAIALPFPLAIVPFVMFGFGLALPKLGFGIEAGHAETFLYEALPVAEGGTVGAYR